MDYAKEYKNISDSLKSMKEEYKIYPTKFLLKKIELADKKLKAYDKSLIRTTKGGGNYKSYNA
jgi:hypothetical protein